MHGGVGSLLTRQGVAVLSYAAGAECVHDVYLVCVWIDTMQVAFAGLYDVTKRSSRVRCECKDIEFHTARQWTPLD